MKRMSLFSLLLLSGFATLVACSEVIPAIQTVAATSDICSSAQDTPNQNPQAPSKWSWMGITVGLSTETDVISELGEPVSRYSWPPGEDKPEACQYLYSLDDNPVIWFAEDRVIGIEFWKSSLKAKFPIGELPNTLKQATELYGTPEFVGWSGMGGGVRSVAWASQGIQAEVYTSRDNSISSILYFIPVSQEGFSDSIWSRLVLDTNPSLGGEFPDFAPKDPFVW